MGHQGLCLLTITFSCLLCSCVALYWAALFSSLLQTPHLWWINNYNKGFQKALAKLDTGGYLCIDGTCFVLVLLKQVQTDSRAETIVARQEQQATLPTTFSLEPLQLFISSFDNHRPCSNLHDSLAAALQVWNNPLRPNNACTPHSFAKECLEGHQPSWCCSCLKSNSLSL